MTRERGARASLFSLTAMMLASGAVAGCNVLVGAGDYKVGEVDGGATDAHFEAGPDTRDSGGVEMETGSPEAGRIEAGAACGSGLPVDDPGFQAVVDTCVLAASCDPFLFQVTMSDCITEDYLHAIGGEACLSTIQNCAGFASCTGLSIPTTAQCPSSSTTASCSGGTAINCGADTNGGFAAQVCSPLQCGTYDDSEGTIASCLVEPSCPPTEEDGTQYCDTTNNNLYQCINGKGYGQNCGTNSTCVNDPVNGAGCYFNGTSTCSTDGYACSGSSVQWCTGGNQFDFNCSTVGLACSIDTDTGDGQCLAPGCTFDDYNGCLETCAADGHTANLCVGGAPFQVDCADPKYGFSSCTFDSNLDGVYCSN